MPMNDNFHAKELFFRLAKRMGWALGVQFGHMVITMLILYMWHQAPVPHEEDVVVVKRGIH